MTRVLILGATGVMGQHVFRVARRLLPDADLVPASRHVPADGGMETRRVDVRDPASVRLGLQGIAAVINAAGPFEYDPRPLVTECLRAGCHYADLAETTPFLRAVEQSVACYPARGTLPGVLSGASTVPGLIQVLAQRWAERGEVCRLRTLLGLGTANRVSPAMLYSLLRPLGRRAPDGLRYFGRLLRKSHRDPRLYGRYPSPFDQEGIVVGARTLPAAFYTGMDRAAYGCALWLAARALPFLSTPALQRLCRLAQFPMPLLRRLGTARGMLSLEALDARGRVIDEIEVRAERDGLVIPALPSVWAVRRFLEAPTSLPPPPLRLDTLFTPRAVIEWLRQEGYQVIGPALLGVVRRAGASEGAR